MEILAGLVLLDRPRLLPAPWFNRPALGLASNTKVRVGLIETMRPNKAAPPDIIVTPLNTRFFNQTVSVTVDLKEYGGSINDLLKYVGDKFNIALMETVTVDQRRCHRVTLVLEPTPWSQFENEKHRQQFKQSVRKFGERLRKAKFVLRAPTIEYMLDRPVEFKKEETASVVKGVIPAPFLDEWLIDYRSSELSDVYDFGRVVVSSNTTGRFIRYIFPKRGAFEAEILHDDIPKSLLEISGGLRELKFNILHSRLSRSAGGREKSNYVPTCEPVTVPKSVRDPIAYLKEVREQLQGVLDKVPPRNQVSLASVSLGKRIDNVSYPKFDRRGIRVVRAAPELEEYIYSRHYGHGQKPRVFISRRGQANLSSAGHNMVRTIEQIVRNIDAVVYDGYENPRPLLRGQANDAKARLWLAEAAIFLVLDDKDEGVFGEGQLVELGYTDGQSKPYVAIVPQGWSSPTVNFMLPVKSVITFKDPASAIDDKDPDYIGARLTQYLRQWFPMGG